MCLNILFEAFPKTIWWHFWVHLPFWTRLNFYLHLLGLFIFGFILIFVVIFIFGCVLIFCNCFLFWSCLHFWAHHPFWGRHHFWIHFYFFGHLLKLHVKMLSPNLNSGLVQISKIRKSGVVQILNTVCLKGPVKKYLPIARARNWPITLDRCHFLY